MVAILREAEKTSVAAAAKKHQVSEQTVYAWRQHFAGLEPSDVKKLKALEAENAKLEAAAGRAGSGNRRHARGQPPKVVSLQACREQVGLLIERGIGAAARLQADRCGALGAGVRIEAQRQGRAGN